MTTIKKIPFRSDYTYKRSLLSTDIPIFIYPRLDSTNTESRRFAEQRNRPLKRPIVFVAETQTGGRGQFDRSWLSEKGGLYYTLLLNNPNGQNESEDTTLNRVATVGVVVQSLLCQTTQLPIERKEPNDILYNGKKCGGILIESFSTQHACYLIIGIGINLNQKKFPETLSLTATSLSLLTDKTYSKKAIIEALTKFLLKTDLML